MACMLWVLRWTAEPAGETRTMASGLRLLKPISVEPLLEPAVMAWRKLTQPRYYPTAGIPDSARGEGGEADRGLDTQPAIRAMDQPFWVWQRETISFS